MLKKLFYILVFLLLSSQSAVAQCAMCRAALSSSEQTAQAEGVNSGIVYLMIFPYLMVAIVGYAVYRLRKKQKAAL
ncbi:hypothetical protein [Flavobacterium rhizosphaerae]|uniref:Uncharacterized protein n=1 Tax=Flavobacterium rhizosphaerae TaxID=3163298 RepID=A0ABW8YSC3_9FLAO